MASTTITLPIRVKCSARASYAVRGGPRPTNCPVVVHTPQCDYYLPLEAWGRTHDYLAGRESHSVSMLNPAEDFYNQALGVAYRIDDAFDENDHFIGHKVNFDIIASTTIKGVYHE